ncbi:MAG: DUF370 domain-containing protein [Oscillospiraceae bacterium]|nr:DUF370 domain-containing protein [Oscillospiraceae bacterium]
MYLYLGGDKALRTATILGIFDLDTVTVQAHSRAFLAQAQQQGCVHDAGGDLPRAFVLADEGIWLAPVNTVTLQKRVYTTLT